MKTINLIKLCLLAVVSLFVGSAYAGPWHNEQIEAHYSDSTNSLNIFTVEDSSGVGSSYAQVYGNNETGSYFCFFSGTDFAEVQPNAQTGSFTASIDINAGWQCFEDGVPPLRPTNVLAQCTATGDWTLHSNSNVIVTTKTTGDSKYHSNFFVKTADCTLRADDLTLDGEGNLRRMSINEKPAPQ
jgi:hypothetical protein